MNKFFFVFSKAIHRVFYKINRPIFEKIIKLFCKIEDNKYLFSSKPTYSDNAKYLCEYIKENVKGEKKIVWTKLYEEKKLHFNDEYDWVFLYGRFNTVPFKTIKEYLTSKYVFYTHGIPVKPRKGQIVINLWHGCGYKDVEKRKEAWVNTFPFNYALVPGKVFIDTKADFWGCDKSQIIPIGYPRYDSFLAENEKAKKFALDLKKSSEKLIVWMPTFRQTANSRFAEQRIQYKYDLSLLSSKDDLVKLNEFCKENKLCLCIKRHPMQKKYSCEDEVFSNIVFINNDSLVAANVNLYDFLKYSDSLISDYSSVAIDYLLLDKPIAFALDDFDQYKSARGFVFENPLDYMPGYHLYSLDDFFNYLSDIAQSKDEYKRNRDELLPKVQNPCDNYCKRIMDFVNNLQ